MTYLGLSTLFPLTFKEIPVTVDWDDKMAKRAVAGF